MGFAVTEILLVGLVMVILFGARKLPELGRGMGQAIREFRSARLPQEREPPEP